MKPGHQKAKILFVDDEKQEIENLVTRLSDFDIVGRDDFNQVFKEIKEKRFDFSVYQAILLDYKMPTSAPKILKQIGENYASTPIPIIVLTAHESVEWAVNCLENGAWAYELKDTDTAILSFKIMSAIRAFEKTQTKENKEQPKTQIQTFFPEIVGYVQQLKEIVDDLELLKEYQTLSKDVRPSGHLLVGDAGCGKTTIARTVGQILGAMIEVKIDDILHVNVGMSEQNAREAIQRAIDSYNNGNKPVLVFADQLETIMHTRNIDHDVMQNVFYVFQDALDSAMNNDIPLYFLGTSNTMETVKSLRSRFSPLFFKKPDQHQRRQLLQVKLQKELQSEKIEKNINYVLLAEMTKGWDGREISREIPRKAILWVKHNPNSKIGQKDLEQIVSELNATRLSASDYPSGNSNSSFDYDKINVNARPQRLLGIIEDLIATNNGQIEKLSGILSTQKLAEQLKVAKDTITRDVKRSNGKLVSVKLTEESKLVRGSAKNCFNWPSRRIKEDGSVDWPSGGVGKT